MRRTLILALLLVGAIAGEASGYARLAVDATSTRGQLHFYMFLSTDQPTARIFEKLPDRSKEIAAVEVPFWRDDPDHGPLGTRTWLVALQPAPYGASQHFAMECHDGTLISSAWSFAPETGAWRHHGCATPQNQSGVVEIETLPPPGARW